MSVKSEFLEKLQARKPTPVYFTSKTQTDITAFRLRMTQLQEQMDVWLTDTGLNVETFSAQVSDLLVEGGTFGITGIVLRYDDQTLSFTPLFLYGQHVTGCVEVTLHRGGKGSLLGRLFMRSGVLNDWTFSPPGARPGTGKLLDESCFFNLIMVLLP